MQGVFSLQARRQIHEMYLFSLIFSFAWSLIIIFEPIFLYQQGFDLSLIALYYALHYTLYILLMPLGAKFAGRFGYERSLAVSAPVLVLYTLVLATLPQVRWFYWVALVVLTLHKIFYWPAYHATFSAYGKNNNRGTEQSWQRSIVYGVGIIGPLLGGLIAKIFGFPVLFMVAAATLMFASVPLLRTKERHHKVAIPYLTAWCVMKQRSEWRTVLGTMGWAEHLVHMVFWPIVLFSTLGGTVAVGIITSISTLLMTVWGFVVGEWSDRKKPRYVVKWSALVEMLSHLIRGVVGAPFGVFVGDALGRVGNTTMEIPFMVHIYERGKRTDPLVYSMSFETTLALSKAIFAFVLVVVFATLPTSIGFMVAFGLAALASLLYALL